MPAPPGTFKPKVGTEGPVGMLDEFGDKPKPVNMQEGGYVKGINQMIDDVNIHGNLYKGGKTFKAGTFRSDRKSNRTY